MAFKHLGAATVSDISVRDPKSILLSAKATASSLKIFSSTDGGSTYSVLEWQSTVPANSTTFAVRSGALADRFPMGEPLQAVITGDSDTFVRIDG